VGQKAGKFYRIELTTLLWKTENAYFCTPGKISRIDNCGSWGVDSGNGKKLNNIPP